MKKIFIIFTIIMAGFVSILSVRAKQTDIVIRNNIFALSMPRDLKKIYTSEVKKDSILIYHNDSKKAGFGGFAFGVKIYKNPADHAQMPGGRKIGELIDKNGVLYDMVLIQPTDVQYDYTKSPTAPKTYSALYDLGNNKKFDINGVKGSKYFKNQGMKGDDLYKDILKKHVTAVNDKWDSVKLEQENMSYMYNVLAIAGDSALDKIGYAYYDVNGDGIEELLIGEIADKDWKGVIYDMYTMVDRKPKHVVSGWSRNRYFVCDDSFVCNDYSGGANASGTSVYILVENSTELFPQVSFKYDGYANPKKPWFLSYSDDEWKNVSEETFNERKKVFERYERFDFIPLKNAVK